MASKTYSDLKEPLQGSINDGRRATVAEHLASCHALDDDHAYHMAFTAVVAVDQWLEANDMAIVPKRATEWMGTVATAGQPLQGNPSLQERIEHGYELAVKAAPELRPPRKP